MNGPAQRGNVEPGPALDTTDEELDMSALVTPEDIEAAKADAARRMTKRGRALLETVRVEIDAADVAAPAIPSD